MKTLAEASGVVARPPAEVFEDVRRRVTGGGHPMRTEVDAERGFLAVQGGWWYRGEYRVTADPAGARVEHRVVNAATWGRWGVPLANRFFVGFRAKTAAAFARMLEELGRPDGQEPDPARTVA
ncbi:hypothetical protein Amsp01_054780 [Amycolatopsis sp. NBRC 101858]|uniref:hypothetical protein n=1 Tax=Amycolatopsis sp. NBRC 101858 TaxID=3032200 RepID=UPI0024A0BEB4|nr:hypothetical protein [Amycolatopsis sp. NBRC 101858]GLY39454.1 hypothetical protein Amsp01_054780 [Amycolatopsis sp. NBRC 101858]